MAIAISPVYLSVSGNRQNANVGHGPFRLPPNHIKDLSDVARGVEESDTGICCSYLVDAMSGQGSDYDEHALHRLESYVERTISEWEFDPFGEPSSVTRLPIVAKWRQRITRCRRTLGKMREAEQHDKISVLYVAHGHPDPMVAQLPELAVMPPELRPLARYTDAVEGWRQDLIRHKARKAASGSPEAAFDLSRHRTMLAWLDRVTSSSDALRDALAPFVEPLVRLPSETEMAFEVRKEARRERKLAHDERRAGLLTLVHRDALQMLSKAEAAYYEAWLTTAG